MFTVYCLRNIYGKHLPCLLDVYSCIFTHVYSCLPKIYSCLPKI